MANGVLKADKIREHFKASVVNGWGFFLPFLLLYLLFWFFRLDAGLLRWVFLGLDVILMLLVLGSLQPYAKRSYASDWLFWGALLAVFLLPGAYLEYPSDPWEHFWRILYWQNFHRIDQASIRGRFAYFWDWSVLFWVPTLKRRLGLALLSAFWQLLLAYQFHRLSLRFGLDKNWSRLGTVAFMVLFGTSIFGWRYYALSSTPLAYIAYLGGLVAFLDFLGGKLSALAEVAPLLLLAQYNHPQEVGLMGMGFGSLALVECYLRSSPRQQRICRLVFFIGFPLSWCVGAWLRHFEPGLYNPVILGGISKLGGFRIWDPALRYWDTLGVSGVLAIALACRYWKRYPHLAVLTLMPTVLLLFPPSTLAISRTISTASDSYRLLYAMPIGLMLTQAFRELSGHRLTIAWIAILLLALPQSFPWRGRLQFVFYHPPSERTLLALDETALWLETNRKYSDDNWIVSDDATQFALWTHLGLTPKTYYHESEGPSRLNPDLLPHRLTDPKPIEELVHSRSVRAFLIAERRLVPKAPPSLIARSSGHWPEEYGDLRWLNTGKFEKLAPATLIRLGWKETRVPPFYRLFEPK